MICRPISDYHTHTRFSPDGHDSMFAMCQRATKLGMRSIAFTEHIEWQPQMQIWPPFTEYFEAINACREHFRPLGLTVLSGVELGNPHENKGQVDALFSRYQFDVVIASLHWLYGENIQLNSCFQGREAVEVYADYFTALGEMAGEFDADIIAHFDRIMWRGALLGTPLDPRRIESTIRDALATIAWRNTALELNTRYLTASPNWRDELSVMLRWYREEGGTRVVVNSDAHGTWQLGSDYDVAMEILEIVGLDPIKRLDALETVPLHR